MDPTNSNPALGTNAPATVDSVVTVTHLPLWLQHDWLQILLVALIAPGLYYMMVMLGRRLKRRHGVRLGILYHAFSLGFAVFLPAVLLRPDWTIVHHIGAFTVIFGGVFIISLVDRYVWEIYFKQLQNIDVPKFLPEVVRLSILIVAIFWALQHFYGQTFGGLIIAPGIAALVIGFAMQDSLGNIISGIALQAGKPYAHGDWLFIDNRYAEVIEVNWRATRLRTNDDIVIEIPHRQMASQTIVNVNRPTRRHAVRVAIGIDYSAPPSRVKDVLLHATANAKGVAPEPKPKVYLKNFGDSSIEYEIKFWIDNHLFYNDVCDSIRTNIWYSLQRHGIKIPFPTRTLQIERPARSKQQEVQSAARLMLRQQPLFKSFTDAQLDALFPRGQISNFGRGEKIIHQGANGDSMFVLVEGEANVVVNHHGFDTHVASLRSGDCFGEMSLLTGEKRSASIVANSDCEVVEIGKPILANSLKENPELLTKLSSLLAQRQMENEGVLAAQTETSIIRAKQTEYQTTFIDKLRVFFEL
ncbi:MAG TPA: mechanosensitive ion channel family protein [Verrucomicrobiae bacterium]|jgi:small-conductance mechanosensitive channel|nr:mechanosensitive ion channel family protein [Verrucomicrobiae bacterium]